MLAAGLYWENRSKKEEEEEEEEEEEANFISNLKRVGRRSLFRIINTETNTLWRLKPGAGW